MRRRDAVGAVNPGALADEKEEEEEREREREEDSGGRKEVGSHVEIARGRLYVCVDSGCFGG